MRPARIRTARQAEAYESGGESPFGAAQDKPHSKWAVLSLDLEKKGLPDREAFRNLSDEAKRNYFFGCPGVAGAGAGFGADARGGADEDFAAPAFTG